MALFTLATLPLLTFGFAVVSVGDRGGEMRRRRDEEEEEEGKSLRFGRRRRGRKRERACVSNRRRRRTRDCRDATTARSGPLKGDPDPMEKPNALRASMAWVPGNTTKCVRVRP